MWNVPVLGWISEPLQLFHLHRLLESFTAMHSTCKSQSLIYLLVHRNLTVIVLLNFLVALMLRFIEIKMWNVKLYSLSTKLLLITLHWTKIKTLYIKRQLGLRIFFDKSRSFICSMKFFCVSKEALCLTLARGYSTVQTELLSF